MGNLFSVILNMSMTGSIVILLVMLARLILRRAPKIFSYALWAVVLFRLLCPVAFTAPVSALKALEPKVQEASESTSVIYFIPAEVNQNSDFAFVPADNQSGTEPVPAEESAHTRLDLMTVASYVWLAGTGIMIAYSVIQYVRMRLKLIGAMAYRGNVYRADYIDTPFVMGILSPKIYLPSDVPKNERKYIIAHERHHISRFDHIIKLLAYSALCIHWFNPLVWAAFILAGKDMEMSCDEAVIRKMGSQIRADYSASLLRLATHKKIIAGMPLAFGEGDTKGRVMNMAKWKKPKLWVSLTCLLLCATILVACAVNPKTAGSSADMNSTEVTGEITCADRLNIREKPDLLSAVVGNYYSGAIVTILETKDGWGRTDMGWISMDYVTTIDDTTLDDPAESAPVPNKLNIRKEPDASSAVVGQYSNGTTITILETKDRWGRTDQGWIVMDYVNMTDNSTGIITIREAESEADMPTVSSSDIVTDIQLIQYGDLQLALPSGLEATDETGFITLTMDSKTVGGIALRHQEQTNSPTSFSTDWMTEIGVQEASDTAMGYMSSGSKYADYEITYFPDLPVNRDDNGNIIRDEIGTYVLENEVTHYFFANGTDVYDIWFYNNRIPNIMRETVLKTCVLEGITDIAAMQTALNEEKEALQQCRSVLEQIQSNGACKIETKQENGPDALNETTLRTDWIHGKDRLHISLIPESGGASMFGGLLVDGAKYECDSAQQWREITWWDWTDPWLVSFQWDDSVVAYMDTLTDESGITVMLRIDQPFAEGENQQPHYLVNFNYDTDGTFRNVYVQTNVFMNNSISKTESIISLDSELVEAEIQREYQNAIG